MHLKGHVCLEIVVKICFFSIKKKKKNKVLETSVITTVQHVTGTKQPWGEGEREGPPHTPNQPAVCSPQLELQRSFNSKLFTIHSKAFFFFYPQEDKINNNI